MCIILISSDSHEKGEKIARKTSQTLDCAYLGRDVLNAVAERYEIPKERLECALEECPRFPGRSARSQRRFQAYIETATLGELLKDNVVCNGLAAHLYVLGVSHALKVRILADPNERARGLSAREHISLEKARRLIERRNKFRRRWSLSHYALDETDPSQYDLVIRLGQIDADEAVRLIAQTAGHRRFAPMTYSLACMKEAELASRVRACLLEAFPNVKVQARGGTVIVETKGTKRGKVKKARDIKERAGTIQGVDYVEVHVRNGLFKKAGAGPR